jgi:ribosomal protein S4
VKSELNAEMPEEVQTITVSSAQSRVRLDRYLTCQGMNYSRNQLQKFIESGRVLVDGKLRPPGYLVKPGDEIMLAGREEQLKSYKETTKILQDRTIPEWMDVASDALAIKIKRLPEKKDVGEAIQVSLIVELYSK